MLLSSSWPHFTPGLWGLTSPAVTLATDLTQAQPDDFGRFYLMASYCALEM